MSAEISQNMRPTALQLASLEDFLTDHPQITLITPASPEYASLRAVFCRDNRDVPLAIVRPQSANDVSLLVKYAAEKGIKFVVRSGGHNLFGKSQVEDALTIDIRDIAHVQVEEGNSSAKVGGGTLQGNLAARLSENGLATAVGSCSDVGYVGWATYGGYGPFSANYGLGVDQILGAKVVDDGGDIVEADEKLLKGIRGAGGVFGIIVEVTIKVYPLKNVLAGVIIYESQNIKDTFEKFNSWYRELSTKEVPCELTVQQMVVNSPFGRVMAIGFMWSSEDFESGKIWQAKFEGQGTVLMSTVAVTNIPDWQHAANAHLAKTVYGSSRSTNLREMNEEVTAVIGSALEKMPSDPAAFFSIHQLRGPSAVSNSRSVFGTRDPHFMLEILGCSMEEEDREKSVQWAAEISKSISEVKSDVILPGTYISLDPSVLSIDRLSLAKIFGSNDQEVLSLKRQYDSKNIFDLAVPRLSSFL